MHTVHTEMRGWMLLVKVEPKPKIKQKETAPVESGAALGRKKAVGYALSERLTSRLENVWRFSASCALVTWTFDSRAPTQCQSREASHCKPATASGSSSKKLLTENFQLRSF